MLTPKHRDFVKRLTPVVLAQVAGLACGVIGVKLSSRFVPPDVLGDYGIFMSFTTLGMWVVHAGLIKYVSRHWAAETAKPALLHRMLRLWFEKLRWVLLSSIAASLAITHLTGNAPWAVFGPLIIIASVLSLIAMGQTALQVNREHWADFRVSATGSLTRTFLPLLCFIALGRAAGLYAGLTLHALVGLGMVAWAFHRHWRNADRATAAPIAVNEIYLGPYFTMLALADWALAGVNRWIVAGTFGNFEAGYFTLAGNIAVILPIFAGTVLKQMFQPGFFALGDALEPAKRRLLARRVDEVNGAFCALAIGGVLVLHLLMPWLVGPLVNERYSAALRWIVPAGFFSTAVIAGQFYHTMLLAARREKFCAAVDLTGAVILIGGGALAAQFGEDAFARWLMFTPLIPWLVSRPLARHFSRRAG